MLVTPGEAKAKLVSNIHLWTPTHGHTKVGQPTRTYISSTGCSLEDKPRVIDDQVERERERERRESQGNLCCQCDLISCYHINKYMYSTKLGFLCLVTFYGISTIVGYLMPNPVYIYIYIQCITKVSTPLIFLQILSISLHGTTLTK